MMQASTTFPENATASATTTTGDARWSQNAIEDATLR